MVSFNVYKSTASGAYVEGVCLATDEKPVVGIANGSILFVVDTESGETTRYMYDQNSMSWIEAACPCGGGSGGSGGGGDSGGGGSGGEGPLLVNIVYEDPAAKANNQKTPALRGGAGHWLDATSLDIFAAAQTRGVVVYQHIDASDDFPEVDQYSPLTSAARVETGGAVTYQFSCLVDTEAANFTGAADAYPKKGRA